MIMESILIVFLFALIVLAIAALAMQKIKTPKMIMFTIAAIFFGEYYVMSSAIASWEKRHFEKQSPEYLAKQAAFILCERNIKKTLENPHSYSHNKLLNTRIINKTGHGDKWSARISYNYINENGQDISESATCAIKDGVSKIVKKTFR